MNKLIDWKDTLLIGKTDFELRANLTTKEPKWRKFWDDNLIYKKALQQNQKNPTFILHDGPPYANGDLHIGHALNKILKDIVVRYKTLEGFYSPFKAGWDTHGLPIEQKVLEQIQKNHKQLLPLTIRQEAVAYAKIQVQKQRQQFLEMQLFSDLKDIYQTFSPDYEANQLKVFSNMLLNNLIYRDYKPVYWSPSSQTALAEAEIEYKLTTLKQIIVAFELKDDQKLFGHKILLLVMTTTPWTLLANSALAIGASFEYLLIEYDRQFYLLAKESLNNFKTWFKVQKLKIIKEIKGQQLLDFNYLDLFNNLPKPIVASDHVDPTEGTGIVHIAPLFGLDDYYLGKKYKLKMIMHLEDNGVFNQKGNQYQGQFYLKANQNIIDDLIKNQKLIFEHKVEHKYPHDWRTGKMVIYRATKQWFVNLKPLKPLLKKELSKIKSYPSWGKERLKQMTLGRQEWTISRQRSWGVPIIVFYNQKKELIIKKDLLEHVIKLIAKEGSDIWWKLKPQELVPKKYSNEAKTWTKELDIMDVWFDSGCSFMVQKDASLYLEGSDQYRGWFNSSFINSLSYQKKAPFKIIVSHGFVLDQNQQKMAKSKGNIISPSHIIKNYGADILRLWVAQSEYSSDVNISSEILDQVGLTYRSLRSKIKFMLANLFDFDYQKNYQKPQLELDIFVFQNLKTVEKQVHDYYQEYKFNLVFNAIYQFINQLSSYYFDINKDILYANAFNDPNRRAIQSNLYLILKFVLLNLAPIMPTTCEEAYQSYHFDQKQKSIFLEKIQTIAKDQFKSSVNWEKFFELKDLVYKLIEDAKKRSLIKRSNQAQLTLEKKYQIFEKLNLKYMFMVGLVDFGAKNTINQFESIKCLRCWNHYLKTEMTEKQICLRCNQVLSHII